MNPFQVLHDAAERPDGGPRAVLDALDRLRGNHLPTVFDGPANRRSQTTGRARVTVIIPCYNYGRYLPDSIGSALDQDGVDVDVIVVNDASSDNSADVARSWSIRDPRVRLIDNPVNRGQVLSFNTAFAESAGDFIVRLDADDMLTPGSLGRATALFDAFPAVGLVYGHPRHFSTPSPPRPSFGALSWTVWSGTTWLTERCRRGVNCITTPEAVIRRSVMDDIGGLRTELRYLTDMEMWLRVSAVADVGRISGSDQALHRDHDLSMSANESSSPLVDLAERRTVFDLVLGRMADRVDNEAQLRQRAMRALASEALDRACHAYDRGQVSQAPVDELVEFASESYAAYQELPEWRALRSRQRVGRRFSPWVPTFAATALGRRLSGELEYLRWTRRGI